MYGNTVQVKRFMVEATVTAFVTVGFSLDDEPTVNSKDELTVATSGSQDPRRRSMLHLLGRAAQPASRWKSRKAVERALRHIIPCVVTRSCD
jgi:hypothetical protein